MTAAARKPSSARGLFRAMGKAAKPVMVDLVDGEAVYDEAPEREADDFYPTPLEPIRALLHAEGARLKTFINGVWEPAAGDGALVREMRAFGLTVHASDLIDRGCDATIRNFYAYGALDAPADAIVTNPPFSESGWGNGKARWIVHSRGVICAPYMALLMPLAWPGPAGLAAVWDRDPPARVYLMRWKIDFTGQGAPPSYHAWYVWDGESPLGETRFLTLDRKDHRQAELFAEGRNDAA